MPDENDAILDAFADWGFEPEEEAAPEQPAEPAPETPEGGDPASPEGSNETPTPQEKSYTETELRQLVQAAQQRDAQQKVASEIQRLLASDEPEDKDKLQAFLKTTVAAQQAQAQTQAQITQAIQKHAESVLDEMGIDDAFLAKLSDEQKAKIDPDKFQTDGAWFKAVASVQAEVMAKEILDARDAEAAKAREEALQNSQKGNQLRQPSLAAVGTSTAPSAGRESNEDLWAGFINEIGLGESD